MDTSFKYFIIDYAWEQTFFRGADDQQKQGKPRRLHGKKAKQHSNFSDVSEAQC